MRWNCLVPGLSLLLLLTACASRRGGTPSQSFPGATLSPTAAATQEPQPAPLPPETTIPKPAATQRTKPATPPAAPATQLPVESATTKPVIVTPANPLVGRISSVNSTARFVVLTYSIGNLPAIERRLNVYREGLKVAELKVTGPSQDINTVADIVAGECQVGDEVRED